MRYLFIFTILLIVFSCSKEKKIISTFQNTTPYTITFPKGSLNASLFKEPEHNKLTNEGVALGRFLFYDPILSGDSTQSCASCHKQKFAFTDGGVRFSKGIDGSLGNRNAMPIVNLAFEKSMFWDGRIGTLEDQALKPIEDIREMKTSVPFVLAKLNKSEFYKAKFKAAFGTLPIMPNHLANALAQFERIIISGDSKFDKFISGQATLTAQETKGLILFEGSDPLTQGDCIHCHPSNHVLTDYEFKNNGLDSVFTDLGRFNKTGLVTDKGKFKTPSLRNIALTAPYMHDGRFSTLDQVVGHYNVKFLKNNPNIDPVMSIQQQDRLSKADRDAIIAFLKTFTDSTLITNQAYSNPF